MKKIIITFLVIKFCEKIIDDGLKEIEGDKMIELKLIILLGLFRNLPILNKIIE